MIGLKKTLLLQSHSGGDQPQEVQLSPPPYNPPLGHLSSHLNVCNRTFSLYEKTTLHASIALLF